MPGSAVADGTARALELLELLQSAHVRTVGELAERLGVDERTVRRDVRRLVEIGLPVESLRGRYGGYRLAPGRRVLPLMFTSEEAVAVFLGLSRGQAGPGWAGVAGQTALAKITRALPADDARRVDAALAAMRGGGPEGVDADPAVMLTLAEAVTLRRVVDLRYRDREGAPSRRTVHPYGLVARAGRWYLVAFDTGRQQERTFRVDRVETARALRETFARPEQHDMAARLEERFADADYRWTVVLRIRGTEEHIRAHLPPGVARLERLDPAVGTAPDDVLPWHRAEIHAESLDWLPGVIAALGCEVVIERPDELRALVDDAARRMLRAAAVDDR